MLSYTHFALQKYNKKCTYANIRTFFFNKMKFYSFCVDKSTSLLSTSNHYCLCYLWDDYPVFHCAFMCHLRYHIVTTK